LKLKYCLNVVCCFLALLFASTANAAWYQIEVIVFEYISPSFDGELWDENPGLPDRSDSIELITELADNDEDSKSIATAGDNIQDKPGEKVELIPFLQSTKDRLRLDGVQRVLELSREYRPLYHVAWQQPGLTINNSRSVHLQKFVESEMSMADKAEDLDAVNSETDLSGDRFQVPELAFDGTIRLRSSTFLHVDVDFAFFPKLFSTGRVDSEQSTQLRGQHADYVRLQESRKIRLNEINYFDHPAFGVILRVSRLNIN